MRLPLPSEITTRLNRARQVLDKAGVIVSDIVTTVRSEGLADGLQVLSLQAILEDRKRTCKKPVGIAAQLLAYGKIEHALRNTPHLGALSVLTKVQATRLDYVRIWCDVILDIKTMNPGLGLNSLAKSVFGNEFGLPESTTLAELMQAWVITLNYGHLFGTFATERALSYHLSENSEYRDSLLRSMPMSSRGYATPYFMSSDYMRLFYGLALWRAHMTKGHIGTLLVGAALTFLEMRKGRHSSVSHGRLDSIFLKSRRIAMRDLHAPLQISSSFPPPEPARSTFYANLFPGEHVIGVLRGHEDTLESVQLEDLERAAFRDFYSNRYTAKVVLTHLVAFKHWWSQRLGSAQGKRGASPVIELCQELFEQPQDWPIAVANQTSMLRHLTRVTFETNGDPRTGWLPAVRSIRVNRAHPDEWSNANFLISPGSGKRLHLDIFISDSHFDFVELNTIARSIAVCLTPDDSVTNLPLADFAIELLQKIACRDQGSPAAYLSPLSSNADKDWLTVLAASRRLAQSTIKTLITGISGDQRREELAWFAEHNFDDDESNPPTLVFLGDLIFKDDNNDVAQIDTFWIEFHPRALGFHFCECKTGKGGGNQQLKKLSEFIDSISSPTQLKSHGRVKVWHAQATFRAAPNGAQ